MVDNYYITYNEFNRGVYKSQVIETLKMYGSLGKDFKLIALLPMKFFFRNRRWVRMNYPNSMIFPAIPGLRFLFLNIIYLLFLKSGSNIICRGSIATNLVLKLRSKFRKIIYDARSAIADEHKEYGNGKKYTRLMDIERIAVYNSDFKLSVSHELVNYWRRRFEYKGRDYIVVPCCVVEKSTISDPDSSDIFFDDIVIVFSGSTHPWQSFPLNCSFVDRVLLSYNNVNVLFLSKENDDINCLISKYGPSRVKRLWVKEDKVSDYLSLCDYGVMLRDDNVTNNVSAPVKFAEYLVNGLNVILSPSVKDYALFVQEHKCGHVWNNNDNIPVFVKNRNKCDNKALAVRYFTRAGEDNLKKIKELLSLL